MRDVGYYYKRIIIIFLLFIYKCVNIKKNIWSNIFFEVNYFRLLSFKYRILIFC